MAKPSPNNGTYSVTTFWDFDRFIVIQVFDMHSYVGSHGAWCMRGGHERWGQLQLLMG